MPDWTAMFWDRLDWPEAAFDGDEVPAWPTALREILLGGGIVVRGANATAVRCDGCDEGHVVDVYEVPNPDGSLRFYIPCPECGRVQVEPVRLFRWTVDLDALARLVGERLGCAGPLETLVSSRVWGLGRLVRGGVARNVVLARGLIWPDARKAVVDSRKIAIANPPLVLAIGRLPADDLWGSKVPAVVQLDQVLALDGVAAVQFGSVDAALGVTVAQPKPARRRHHRHERASTIDALTRAMKEHFRAARDHAYSLKQRGREPALLPRPTEKQLAAMVGVDESTVSRAINDEHAAALRLLWDAALELDQVMQFVSVPPIPCGATRNWLRILGRGQTHGGRGKWPGVD